MKLFGINTWGGGTPVYLVAAEDKECAWELVKNEWNKKYNTINVGGNYYLADKYQTIDNLKELNIKYLMPIKEGIVDINNLL